MRRIDQTLRGQPDRGAVAVFVAILMVALIGFAAIGVDVANMASDKQQLQNGADAAAFAIAETCAQGDCDENYDSNGVAEVLATNNKNDERATIADIDIDLSNRKVTVIVEDETEHWFAGIWGEDSRSSLVQAKATVSWNYNVVSVGGLPLALDEGYLSCVAGSAKEAFTGVAPPAGSVFEESDKEGFFEYTGGLSQVRIFLADWANPKKDPKSVPSPDPSVAPSPDPSGAGCSLEDGQWTPGGFGWIIPDDGCWAETSIGEQKLVQPGEPPPTIDCRGDYLKGLIESQTPLAIPVFQEQDASGKGANGNYVITGYVAFVLDGVNVPSAKPVVASPFANVKKMCENSENPANEFCIVGHFVEVGLLDGVGEPSGADSGVYVLRLEE